MQDGYRDARLHGWRTTAGMQDDCRDAGRLQGWRTTAGMQDDCRDAGARVTPGAVAELE